MWVLFDVEVKMILAIVQAGLILGKVFGLCDLTCLQVFIPTLAGLAFMTIVFVYSIISHEINMRRFKAYKERWKHGQSD